MSCAISRVVEVICEDVREMQEIQREILSSGISPVEMRVCVDNSGAIALHVPCATMQHAEHVCDIADRVQTTHLALRAFASHKLRARSQ